MSGRPEEDLPSVSYEVASAGDFIIAATRASRVNCRICGDSAFVCQRIYSSRGGHYWLDLCMEDTLNTQRLMSMVHSLI